MNPLELKAARVRLGYKQKDVARILEISETAFRHKENGRVGISDEEKIKLSELYGFDLQKANDVFFDGRLPIGQIIAPNG